MDYIYHTRKGKEKKDDELKSKTDTKSKKVFYQKVGCRKDKLMAQQVQEIVYNI